MKKVLKLVLVIVLIIGGLGSTLTIGEDGRNPEGTAGLNVVFESSDILDFL